MRTIGALAMNTVSRSANNHQYLDHRSKANCSPLAERERAEAEAKLAERREQEEQTGKKKLGREPKAPDPEHARPEAKAQRNFTGSQPQAEVAL
jgi:hypothetical protein